MEEIKKQADERMARECMTSDKVVDDFGKSIADKPAFEL